MLRIISFLLTFVACVLAADQAPDVANALLRQYRPITTFSSCRSTGGVKANCGFCYGGSGTFLGWNCNCDSFCSGTKNNCYYILENDPNNYAQVTCQP